MKKIYLVVALLFSGNMLFAQNLTRTDVGCTPGDNYTMFSSNYVSPGTAGTGVTWDLSAMTNNSQVTVVTTANSGGSFPSANVKLTQSNGGVLYYNISSTKMEVVGLDANGTVFTYSNPATYLQFPINTSYNYTDASAATFSVSGFAFNRTGSIQSEYSGTGTLITPAGTFTNVVRIKSTQTNVDTYSGGTINSSIVAYNWYKAGVTHELANVSDITGSSTSQSAYYTSVPANLGLEESELINLLMFPNPTTGAIHINSDELISKVEVYQLSGELAMEQAVNSTSLEMDLSTLNAGMYLVKVYGNNGAVSIKRVSKN
jgi:hypothetical protein